MDKPKSSKHQRPIITFFVLGLLLSFIIALKPLVFGHINFWYDPARDLLLAWNNLKKLSLIGVPSGIPGIFYGPYWIWFLSLAMIVSKDPRVILFLVITVPYFILTPFIFYKLAKKWLGRVVGLSICLLFMFFFINNYNQIWNPNLAPLLFISEAYLFYISPNISSKVDVNSYLFLGIIQGLLLNFHISFGLGILLSLIIYFIVDLIWDLKKPTNKKNILFIWFINSGFFVAGFLIVFIPFFLFEIRHGFNQIKSLIYTFELAVFHNAPVVSQVGLSKAQIIDRFINRLTTLLSLPQNGSLMTFVIFLAVFGMLFMKSKKNISSQEVKILIFLILNIIGILVIYLTSKNPVWDYHFIAVEVIYLLLIGFLMRYSRLIRLAIIFWIAFLVLKNVLMFTHSFRQTKVYGPDLLSEKETVLHIFTDAGNLPFAYAASNAAIYTYEYDYLFKWLGETKYHFEPANQSNEAKIVYLIIPQDRQFDSVGFAQSKTPDKLYKSVRSWHEPDGGLIIRRQTF